MSTPLSISCLLGALAWLCAPLLPADEPPAPADACISPTWRSHIPRPVYPDAELIELYDKTWEIASRRVRRGPAGLPASPYLDENCYEDQIWIWDTCFMVLFAKYAPGVFPGVESLDNLYLPIHEGSPTPLKIHFVDNPPLFAWVESAYYDYSGDRARLRHLLCNKRYLQKHFRWFSHAQRGVSFDCSPQPTHLQAIGQEGFIWSGRASGMDNSPRGRDAGGYDRILWVDAISQQALSARCLAELSQELGLAEEASQWADTYHSLKEQINKLYWDEQDGFYYDIDRESHRPCRVRTIASFWPLLAGVASPQQAQRMLQHMLDPALFGGDRPAPSLARSDCDHDHSTGDYWRGGIWLPTAYMAIKALEQYHFYAEADSIATRLLRLQLATYKQVEPHTIWECYSPGADAPSTEHGRRVRSEFCGWSALGPISLFIENILGFRRISAARREVYWSLHPNKGPHGIRNLRFGPIVTDIIFDGRSTVTTRTNHSYILIINGVPHTINEGYSQLSL